MVFQDPQRRPEPVDDGRGGGGATPLRVHGVRSAAERRTRVVEALERVGLSPVELFLSKYPRDLSGGQKQRVVMARAIVLDPELLVADEPVSMLDMSVRAKILQLMLDLKKDLGLTYVYITHDLATAKYFCDRIAIMYLGRVVEIGPTDEIFANPRHPYTKALLAAIPEPDPDKTVPRDLPRGEIPDAAAAARWAARSTLGAPRRSPPAGGSRGTCGHSSRSTGCARTRRTTRSRTVIGDLDASGRARRPSRRSEPVAARPVRAILDRMKAEDTAEPLWSGVTSIEDAGSGVTVHFEPAPSPALRRAGGVEVACVLYPDEGTGRTRTEPHPGAGRSTSGQWKLPPVGPDPGVLNRVPEEL